MDDKTSGLLFIGCAVLFGIGLILMPYCALLSFFLMGISFMGGLVCLIDNAHWKD